MGFPCPTWLGHMIHNDHGKYVKHMSIPIENLRNRGIRGRGSVPRSDFLGQEVHLIIRTKFTQFADGQEDMESSQKSQNGSQNWNDFRYFRPLFYRSKFSRISDFRGQTSYSKGFGKGTKDAKVLRGDVTFGSFWTQKNLKSNI